MDRFEELYNELLKISRELLPYYDIDKVKSHSVYVWTKDNGDYEGENVFDIISNKIIFYIEGHQIPKEAMPIIKRIQFQLGEIESNIQRRGKHMQAQKIYIVIVSSHGSYENRVSQEAYYELKDAQRFCEERADKPIKVGDYLYQSNICTYKITDVTVV